MTRAYVGVAMAVLVALGVWYFGHTRFEAGELSGNNKVAALKTEQAQKLQHLAELTTRAYEAALTAERQQSLALAAVAASYEKDKQHAKESADRTVAELRTGVVRLRAQWSCPASTGVPSSATATVEPDAGAALRAASAGRIVGAGAEADAQVRGLQRALMVCTGVP